MLWIALILLGVLILASLAMALTFTIIHLVTSLAVAGFVGWLADMVVPGELPYGWLGAVVAGVVGGWVGALVLGNFGPALFGVHLLPSFVGAAVVALGAEVALKSRARP